MIGINNNLLKTNLKFRAMSINKVFSLRVYLNLDILLRVGEQSAVAGGAVPLEALLAIA